MMNSSVSIPASSALDTNILGNISSALLVTLSLLLILAWAVKHFRLLPRYQQNQLMKVLDTCSLSTKEKIILVEVNGAWLVLGVTPQQITLLHHISLSEQPEILSSEVKEPRFQTWLEKALTRQKS